MRTTARILIIAALFAFIACTHTPSPSDPTTPACAAELRPPVPRLGSSEGANIVAPVVLQRVTPLVDRSVPDGVTATVEAVIGEDGVPRHVCIASGDPAWGRFLVAAVRQWRFQPGTLDGKPVPVIFSVTSVYREH